MAVPDKDAQPGKPPPDLSSARDRAAHHLQEQLDEALADSFPASDPPPWTTGRERHMHSGDPDGGGDRDRERRRRHLDA